MGQEQRLVADAVNSLSDSITDAVALIGFCITGKPHDATHDFGHAKFETLSTLVIGIFLIAAAGFILWNSIDKIISVAGGVPIEKISVIALIPAALQWESKTIVRIY